MFGSKKEEFLLKAGDKISINHSMYEVKLIREDKKRVIVERIGIPEMREKIKLGEKEYVIVYATSDGIRLTLEEIPHE